MSRFVVLGHQTSLPNSAPTQALGCTAQRIPADTKVLSPTQKLNPVPKKGVEMRVPTTIEISLPDTVGPSSGEDAVTCSGPGRFCTGVPAQGMPTLRLRHADMRRRP